MTVSTMSGDAKLAALVRPETVSSGKTNPGSDRAVERGCTCPVLDNGRGRGYMGQSGIFVFNAGCPLHDVEESEETR